MRRVPVVAVAAIACLLLAVCADPFDNNNGPDNDEDGFGQSLDCDDDNPNINPDALEKENCIDDNCDGKVDEGTPNEDKDLDGFCPSTGDATEYGCEGNPERNPNKPEDGGNNSDEPNGIDDNCNGLVDDGLPGSDIDGDGFTVSGGDCNDADEFINPGAIEVVGFACDQAEDCPPTSKCIEGYCRCQKDDDCSSLDACIQDSQCKNGEKCDGKVCRGIWLCLEAPEGMGQPNIKVCRDNTDNDCDQKTDEVQTPCDDPAKLDVSDPYDYARAMDLCETDHTCGVDQGCPGNLACVDGKCLRVLNATFNAEADAASRTISNILAKAKAKDLATPRKNLSFAIFSSGKALYDPYALDQCPQSGTEFGNTGLDPDPSATDSKANDISELKLEILVPTNAKSFSFDFHFLTTEYPEFLDTQFNDTFWVQLNSKKFTGNISFDKNGTPIRLNNAFFDICDPDPARPQTAQFCTRPAKDLDGTGYFTECAGDGTAAGGATGWLTTVAPVEPGEKITLTFTIFDKGDHILDSVVLIDNFRWSLTPASKPTTGPK